MTIKGELELSSVHSKVATLANLGSKYINAGLEARRLGTAHASIVPYQSFKTKDGYMTIGCGNDLQFQQVSLDQDVLCLFKKPFARLFSIGHTE